MDPTSSRRFDRFILDRREARLLDGAKPVPLTPKAFALLGVLLERSGSLVTKDELLDRVWPGVHVGDSVLKECIRELRKALGDDADEPRFVETVHRRGYRFLVEPEPSDASVPPSTARAPATSTASGDAVEATKRTVVGRETELARLEKHFELALAGRRQLVFVTGEAGIGKTTLIETFLERSAAADEVRVARGQCIESYGAGEAYLPLLEVLGRLCRGSGAPAAIAALSRYAPTWLAQLPWLLEAGDRGRVEHALTRTNHQRMLREFAEFLEAFSAEQPLVVVLEDLQWSDSSTVELLSVVARRTEPARALILGTYRPAELIVTAHPLMALKRDLGPRRQSHEVALDLLSQSEIDLYLSRRFPSDAFPPGLARAIHGRTDGHPLFMTSVVDYAIAEGLIDLSRIEIEVPDNLREMIERQIDALSPEDREAIRTASVAGVEFPMAAIASALGQDVAKTEPRFEELARQGRFVRATGVISWPDGTVTGRYAFLHALYRDVAYHGLPQMRRLRLHQRIGERLEQSYGDRASEIAAELAVHFEEGRNASRAIHYLQQAGANASRRFANVEAIRDLGRAIELVATLPDTIERAREELQLRVAWAGALTTAKGFAVPEVGANWARVRELCDELSDSRELLSALMGLRLFHTARAELGAALDIGERMLALAARAGKPTFEVQARYATGMPLQLLGELEQSLVHFDRGIAVYDRAESSRAMLYRQDLGVGCLVLSARTLWLLGYPDQAAARVEQAVRNARDVGRSPTLAFGLLFAAVVDHFRGDVERARARAEEALDAAREHDFPFFRSEAAIVRGWASTMQGRGEEGIRELERGLVDWGAIGCRYFEPYFRALLAEAYEHLGRIAEAIAAVEAGLAVIDETKERWWEAELYRLKAGLVRQSTCSNAANRRADAEASLEKAIAIARAQRAKSLELRALASLARLHTRGEKAERSRAELADLVAWFTEGLETPDLETAKAMLEEKPVAARGSTSRSRVKAPSSRR